MTTLKSGDQRNGKQIIQHKLKRAKYQPPLGVASIAQEIAGMEGLSVSERQKLIRAGIKSADDFWAWIGRDSNSGISLLAAEVDIDQKRIIEIAATQALNESEKRTFTWPQRLLKSSKDHWLDIALILSVGLIAVLFFRATGFMNQISSPIGLPSTVIVSASDLQQGTIIEPDKLLSVRLIPRSNYFTDANQVTGLILAQNIERGNPIRFEQVLRLQMIATRDLPPGTIITNDAITLAWSLYQPDATANPNNLLGRKVTRTFRTGDAITIRFIGTQPEDKAVH